MDENKLSYRRIRNDVHIRLNNKEAATFLALMFYSDFNTGESKNWQKKDLPPPTAILVVRHHKVSPDV